MKKLFFILFLSALFFGGYAQTDFWVIKGNDGITSSNFLGTLDCAPLIFKTNSIERMRLVLDRSALGIGVVNPHATLHLHLLQVDDRPCNPLGNQSGRRVLQITTPETGNSATNGFSISSLATKEIVFEQYELADLSIKGPGGGFTIVPDGKIGVGLSLPQAKLDVNGSFKAQSAKITEDAYILGNTGIGTTNPLQRMHINDGNLLISKDFSKTGSSPLGALIFDAGLAPGPARNSWGIEYLEDHMEGPAGLNFWSATKIGPVTQYAYSLFLGDDGSVGVGNRDPQAELDVSGSFKAQSANITGALTTGALTGQSANITGNAFINGNVGIGISSTTHKLHVVGNTFLNGNVGIGKAPTQRKLDVNGDIAAQGTFVLNEGTPYCTSFGSAYSSLLNFGSSYIGFNATRNNGNWALAGDGANNGGGVIYTNVWGEMYFASIPSTGANPQTLTDAQIKSNIKLSLSANGKLRAKEITVSLAGWPDYVFEEDYKLLPLAEVEQYIKQNSRLPQVPSAQEIEENGLDLGDMQGKLLLKIEELTLYIIDLQKQVDELKLTKGEKP